jgi:hypothetical protein
MAARDPFSDVSPCAAAVEDYAEEDEAHAEVLVWLLVWLTALAVVAGTLVQGGNFDATATVALCATVALPVHAARLVRRALAARRRITAPAPRRGVYR